MLRTRIIHQAGLGGEHLVFFSKKTFSCLIFKYIVVG